MSDFKKYCECVNFRVLAFAFPFSFFDGQLHAHPDAILHLSADGRRHRIDQRLLEPAAVHQAGLQVAVSVVDEVGKRG